jgi:hypothetical protein
MSEENKSLGTGAKPAPERLTVEEWTAKQGTPEWAIAGARVRANWAIGSVLTQKEYDAGIDAFVNGPTHPDLAINLKEGDK